MSTGLSPQYFCTSLILRIMNHFIVNIPQWCSKFWIWYNSPKLFVCSKLCLCAAHYWSYSAGKKHIHWQQYPSQCFIIATRKEKQYNHKLPVSPSNKYVSTQGHTHTHTIPIGLRCNSEIERCLTPGVQYCIVRGVWQILMSCRNMMDGIPLWWGSLSLALSPRAWHAADSSLMSSGSIHIRWQAFLRGLFA